MIPPHCRAVHVSRNFAFSFPANHLLKPFEQAETGRSHPRRMATIKLASNAAITATGPLSATPTNAIGSGDYTLTVAGIGIEGRVRVGIEDSPDGTTWTPLAVWVLTGNNPIGDISPTNSSRAFRSHTVQGLKTTASAAVRINIYECTGNCHLNASIDYPS